MRLLFVLAQYTGLCIWLVDMYDAADSGAYPNHHPPLTSRECEFELDQAGNVYEPSTQQVRQNVST